MTQDETDPDESDAALDDDRGREVDGSDDAPAPWSTVGPALAAGECNRRRAEVDDALRELTSCWRQGDDVDAADVRRAREAMNAARRFLEDVAAPVAGGEPWGERPPSVPVGAIREHYGGIRPPDDLDDEDAADDT